MVAISDALATFRVLMVPATTTDSGVDSVVAREFPLDPERMGTKWVDVHSNAERRVIYATAWDRPLIKNVTGVIKAAGLESVTVDLKSACIARAVAEPSCIVVDMSSDPVEIFLIDGHIPRVWHSFELTVPIGEDVAPALAPQLRTVIRFNSRRRDTEFGPRSPILISGEQMPSSQVLTGLSQLLEHPVEPLRAPARVPDIRYGTYLTCLGLLMRRSQSTAAEKPRRAERTERRRPLAEINLLTESRSRPVMARRGCSHLFGLLAATLAVTIALWAGLH